MNAHDMLEEKITAALGQALLETYGFAPAALVSSLAHRTCGEIERYRAGRQAVFVEESGEGLDPKLASEAVRALGQSESRKRRVPVLGRSAHVANMSAPGRAAS